MTSLKEIAKELKLIEHKAPMNSDLLLGCSCYKFPDHEFMFITDHDTKYIEGDVIDIKLDGRARVFWTERVNGRKMFYQFSLTLEMDVEETKQEIDYWMQHYKLQKT